MTLHTQLLTMLTMIVGGIYLGFAEETYRRITVRWKHNQLFTYILEMMFWALQATILFYALYRVNNGELRAYIFLACLLGFSMYVVLFKAIYQKCLEWFIHILLSIVIVVIDLFYTLLIQPIRWMVDLLWRLFLFTIRLCASVLLLLMKIIFYPLILIGHVVKKIIPEKMTASITSYLLFYSTILVKIRKKLMTVFWKRR